MNIESSVFGQEPDDIDVMLMSMDNDEIKSTIIGKNKYIKVDFRTNLFIFFFVALDNEIRIMKSDINHIGKELLKCVVL